MNNFERTFETRYGNQTAETHYSITRNGFGYDLKCEVNFEGEKNTYTLFSSDYDFVDAICFLDGEDLQNAISLKFWKIDMDKTTLKEIVEWIETELEETEEECDLCYGEGQKAIKTREYSDGRGGYDIDCEFDDCPRCKGRGECSKAKNL
jgi:hypothetical protein